MEISKKRSVAHFGESRKYETLLIVLINTSRRYFQPEDNVDQKKHIRLLKLAEQCSLENTCFQNVLNRALVAGPFDSMQFVLNGRYQGF